MRPTAMFGLLLAVNACSIADKNESTAAPETIGELGRCPENDECNPNIIDTCPDGTLRAGQAIPCVLVSEARFRPSGNLDTCTHYAAWEEICELPGPDNWGLNPPVCPWSVCLPGQSTVCSDGTLASVCGISADVATNEDGPYWCIAGQKLKLKDCPEAQSSKWTIFANPVLLVDTYANQTALGEDTRVPPGAWFKVAVDQFASAALINVTAVVSAQDTGISWSQPAGAPFVFAGGPTVPEGEYPYLFPVFGSSYNRSWQTTLFDDGTFWVLNDTRSFVHFKITAEGVKGRVLP